MNGACIIVIVNFLAFLVFADKPKSTNDGIWKMFAWCFWPLILLGFVVVKFIERKQLKWLSRRWFLVGLNEGRKYLLYDEEVQKEKKDVGKII